MFLPFFLWPQTIGLMPCGSLKAIMPLPITIPTTEYVPFTLLNILGVNESKERIKNAIEELKN